VGPEAGSEAEVLEPHDLHGRTGPRLSVSLVTPTGSLIAREIDEIVAPGVQGEFGVLPGHVPFLSALKAGVLTIRAGTERHIYAVGPGILQVGAAGKTQVLVQKAVPSADIDVEAARAQRTAAEEQLRQAAAGAGEPGTAGAPGAVGLAQANLEWALAQLAARETAGAK
jgi:F-type H+-transporting ATPase subunit epsilon